MATGVRERQASVGGAQARPGMAGDTPGLCSVLNPPQELTTPPVPSGLLGASPSQ